MRVRGTARRHIARDVRRHGLRFLVLLVYWAGVLPGRGHGPGPRLMFALMALAWCPTRPPAVMPPPRSAPPAAGTFPRGRPALRDPARHRRRPGLVGGIPHPHEVPPNYHAAVFAEYAHSTDWLWVHVAPVPVGARRGRRVPSGPVPPATRRRAPLPRPGRRLRGGRRRGPHRREHGRGRRRPQAGGRRLGGRGPRRPGVPLRRRRGGALAGVGRELASSPSCSGSPPRASGPPWSGAAARGSTASPQWWQGCS